LTAAGYAPGFYETDLDAPQMAAVRRAIDLILRHQEPYPAFVLDRHWNIRLANPAAERCTRFLLGRETAETNMIRLLLHPDGLRQVRAGWEETAGARPRQLHAHTAAAPGDEAAAALLEEVLAYPEIPRDWRRGGPGARSEPLLATVFRREGVELRFFATL